MLAKKYSLNSLISKAVKVWGNNPKRLWRIIVNRIGYNLSWINGWRAPFASNVFLNIFNRCNLKCVMCDLGHVGNPGIYSRNIHSRHVMPTNQWLRLIDEVAPYSPGIFFPAPEPLLNADIAMMVERAKKHGLFCSVATNGLLLDRFIVPFLEAGLDSLEISIDGTPELHDKIRGVPKTFSRCVSAVKEVIRQRGQCKTPKINITVTITHLNYHRLLETLDTLALEFPQGIRGVTVSHLSHTPKDIVVAHNASYPEFLSDVYTPSEVALGVDTDTLFKELTAIVRCKYPFPITVSPNLSHRQINEWYHHQELLSLTHTVCGFPWQSANIMPNGDVTISNICGPVLGNVTQETLSSIWNNSVMRKVRHDIYKIKMYPICIGCCGSRVY